MPAVRGSHYRRNGGIKVTSTELRSEKRYKRRKAARDAAKARKCALYDDYDGIISFGSLYKAAKKSRRNVGWKASVQRYDAGILQNTSRLHKNLAEEKNITKGFVEFDLMERGKKRHIKSVTFSERVVHRSVADNSLVPMLSRSLIYDNGACLKGKGVDFALDRLDAFLGRFYKKNGFSNDGYVLLFDLKGYFDSILHEKCFEIYGKAYSDKRITGLLETFVRPFGYPDASTDWRRQKKHNPNSEPYSGTSLGLGSQVSQITAVSYLNALDHYIKQELGVKEYERYMDDGCLLFKTKAEARDALEKIKAFISPYGVRLNLDKTQIVKLSRGFIFLKVRYKLTETGKVLRKISPKSVTAERRKLKKLKKKADCGDVRVADIRQAYGSWKGYALRRNAGAAIARLDALFFELYGEKPPECRLEKKMGLKHIYKQQAYGG